MGKRRLARETALQALYLLDVSSTLTPREAFDTTRSALGQEDPASEAFGWELVENTTRHIKDLDQRIQSTAANWQLGRMAAVDRSILRMATYELLHRPDTPVGVVIDEAIEIAKKYASEKSPAFINGILDNIRRPRPSA